MPRFVPRERKHKKLARQASQSDTNVQEILPVSQSEREAKRAALKQQLREQQPESKFSSQKRKRLEKYVDTKLRKEENAELIRKLAAQQVDTSSLQSSKTLGKSQESKKEKRQRTIQEHNESASSDEETLSDPQPVSVEKTLHPIQPLEQHIESTHPGPHPNGVSQTAYGAGLKRPLASDESGRPLIPKRKRRKVSKSRSVPLEVVAQDSSDHNESESGSGDDEAWNGFSDDGAVSDDNDASTPGTSDHEDEDDEDSSSDSSLEASDGETKRPARMSAFKVWGQSQLNAAVGFTPSPAVSQKEEDAIIKANFKPRAPSPDPLLDSMQSRSTARAAPVAAAITVSRSEETQKSRLNLPVVQEEQKIVETIHMNRVTLICGATGSGKTTQVPQMLFENGYGSLIGSSSTSKDICARRMIGVTQPRRVAATSVADRVAHELGVDYGKRVAHQVRYDTNVSRDTAIKFMTDGILLREIQADFALEKYSCIIIDEAHERSVNTDILIGLLSRIVPLRDELAVEQPEKFCPLKLVIMSATLRVNDFLQNDSLFQGPKPPIVDVEGRQYSVTEHFARRTARDYVSEMVEKVARGHRKLPPGGILVFLTGQDEITTVSNRLREMLSGSNDGIKDEERSMWIIDDTDDNDKTDFHDKRYFEDETNDIDDDDSGNEIGVADNADEFEVEDMESDKSHVRPTLKPYIVPLYAALPASQQQKVFQTPPEGHRLIILATNVAETSLTIPGIRYVFDSGRSKEKRYNHRSGVQTFEVGWISKASAAQRQGRAGRTGPGGHVWRLYSSAVYERDFDEYTVPEILRTPLESVVLHLKGFEIERVMNFPFPTAPDREQLLKAERLLNDLGAIAGGKISEIGTGIMAYPVNPRLGKILWLAKQNQVMQHAIAVISGLAVGDLFIPEAHSHNGDQNEGDVEAAQKRYQTALYRFCRACGTLVNIT